MRRFDQLIGVMRSYLPPLECVRKVCRDFGQPMTAKPMVANFSILSFATTIGGL